MGMKLYEEQEFLTGSKDLKKIRKMCMMMHKTVIPSPTGPMKMMKSQILLTQPMTNCEKRKESVFLFLPFSFLSLELSLEKETNSF
jgi:hypothetical protein